MKRPENDAPGWFDRPQNIRKIWGALIAACILLVAAEFVFGRQAHFEIERIPGFFAIFGFLSLAAIVFAGRLLRSLIMRDEDYYERD